jgi:hypothetical protein
MYEQTVFERVDRAAATADAAVTSVLRQAIDFDAGLAAVCAEADRRTSEAEAGRRCGVPPAPVTVATGRSGRHRWAAAVVAAVVAGLTGGSLATAPVGGDGPSSQVNQHPPSLGATGRPALTSPGSPPVRPGRPPLPSSSGEAAGSSHAVSAGETTYLDSLTPARGSWNESGMLQLANEMYPHAVASGMSCGDQAIEYHLPRQYSMLTATIGLDGPAVGPRSELRLFISIDDRTVQMDVVRHVPTLYRVDIPGGQRLTLRWKVGDKSSCSGTRLVLADASLRAF